MRKKKQQEKTRNRVQAGATELQEEFGDAPKIAFIFGSGMSEMLDNMIRNGKTKPFSSFGHFPNLTVDGHKAEITVGTLGISKVPVVILKGRKHFYEGATSEEIVRPVRILAEWGVETFILTNASGLLEKKKGSAKPGDIILIDSHVSLFMDSPLIGINDDSYGKRFPDMADAYNEHLKDTLSFAHKNITERKTITAEKKPLYEGTYVGVNGPQFETKAEIQLLRFITSFNDKVGIVGMSTIPEVIALMHYRSKSPKSKIRVVAVSIASNYGTEIAGKVSHAKVGKVVQKTVPFLAEVFRYFVTKI